MNPLPPLPSHILIGILKRHLSFYFSIWGLNSDKIQALIESIQETSFNGVTE